MRSNIFREVLRKLLFFFFLFLIYPVTIFSQCLKGRVFSSETSEGLGFVSIGIVGKNIGTVASGDGNFSLIVDRGFDNDSLRFSMIGYYSKTLCIKKLRDIKEENINLVPKSYVLGDVNIVYSKPRKKLIGTPVMKEDLKSGFGSNNLGSEVGLMFTVNKKVRLKDLNINVATCTYDTVTYRLNIYKVVGKEIYENILTEPIYITFTKEETDQVVTSDLSKYSIIIDGSVVVALELYRDLGEGKLLFNTQYFTGYTLHRESCEGAWSQSSGAIGMYLNSNEIRQ